MIVKVIDRRYLQRAIVSFNETVRIRHEEGRYDEALQEASFHLNPLGMDQYHKCTVELAKRREKLDVIIEDDEGRENPIVVAISEKDQNVEEPVRYDTSPDQGYCKRFLKKGICLHILFLREYHDLPAFDTSLFLRFRYLKNLASYDVDKEHPAGEGVSPANEPEDDELYDGDGVSEKASKPQDRYFEVVEVTKQICDIAPKYAPKQFKVVLETLKEFEKLIRTNGIDDNVLKFLKSPNSYNLILKASQTEDTQDSFEVPTNTEYQQSHNTGTQSGNSNNPDMQDTETHTTRTNNQDTHTTNAENQDTPEQGTQDQGTHDASTQDEEDDVNMFYQDMNNSIQAEDVEDMWDAADSEEHEMESPGLPSRGRSMVSGIIPNMSSQLPGSPRLPSQLPKSSSFEPGLSSQDLLLQGHFLAHLVHLLMSLCILLSLPDHLQGCQCQSCSGCRKHRYKARHILMLPTCRIKLHQGLLFTREHM